MTAVNLNNVQGDMWSRGFPKLNETYYFFSIVAGKEKDFSKALAALGKSGQISTLNKVLADWVKVDGAPKSDIAPVSNALIAFSKTGLDKIQIGLTGGGLGLGSLTRSDPAFAAGMSTDGPKNLNDPAPASWDPLFNTTPIHGVLKVAGSSPEIVNSKLNDIKSILGAPTIIADVAAQSLPTSAKSRVDGQVRPKDQGLNGHEHFGFEDGASQPLLKGINTDVAFNKDTFMQTPQNIITVSATPPPPQPTLLGVNPAKRPAWMVEGSFLVFRKLEQNVQGFIDLTQKFESAACANADHCGAKLMGRWKSGAPIVLFPNQDTTPTSDPIANNNFKFTSNNVCPLAAHIRKTNPRDPSNVTRNARIVRHGIPYGTEFSVDKSGKRGLLFACYQSSIENGFQFIQKTWINNPQFPPSTSTAGFDAFAAQPPNDGKLHTTLFHTSNKAIAPGLGDFPKLVTMKGGEYFFVPSISALTSTLGSA